MISSKRLIPFIFSVLKLSDIFLIFLICFSHSRVRWYKKKPFRVFLMEKPWKEEKKHPSLESWLTERKVKNWDGCRQKKRVKEDTLNPRPVVLVTCEQPCLFLPRPVTSLCHILFSQALPSTLCVSAPRWPNRLTSSTQLTRRRLCSILQGLLYTSRNERSKFEFQSLTSVSSKASIEAETLHHCCHYILVSVSFPLLLPGMTRLAALQAQWPRNPVAAAAAVPRHPHRCKIVSVSTGVASEKWSAVISSRQTPLFSLSCTLCNSHGDKGKIWAFHGRKYEKPGCEKVKLLFWWLLMAGGIIAGWKERWRVKSISEISISNMGDDWLEACRRLCAQWEVLMKLPCM